MDSIRLVGRRDAHADRAPAVDDAGAQPGAAGQRDRRRLLAVIALAVAAIGLLLAYHAWWLLRMRDGYAVDIDEAGYISIALNDLAGWRAGGLGGLWDAFQQQAPHAPLVPLLAVPALAVHRAIMTVYTVELLALVVTVLATYGIARRLAGARWGALAAVVVAAMPGVINYTREFSFALPCAAAVTVAAWALLRSEHGTRTRWMLLWGAAAGAAVLARTMAIGFLPGIGIAGLVIAAGAPAGLRRRAAANVALGTGAGLVVAGTWYLRNADAVMDYLTGFGYGDKAAEYGNQPAVLSPDWLLTEIRLALTQQLYLPLFLVLALVLVAAAPFAFRSARAAGAGATARRVVRSPAFALALIPLEGYLALTSTENGGSAFALPLLPVAIALIVAAAARLPQTLRQVALAGFVAVSVLQLVSFAQIGLFDRIHTERVPLLDTVVLTDPRPPALQAAGQVQNALRFGEADRGWLEASRELIERASAHAGANGRLPIVAFGTRDRLLNTNMVQLAGLLYRESTIPLAQLDPIHGGDTPAAYARFLDDPVRGQPNVLVTSADERNDFEPAVSQQAVVAAARRLGFEPFATVRQPNGERATLWWLPRGPAIPSAPAPAP